MNRRLALVGLCVALAPSGATFGGVTVTMSGEKKDHTIIEVEGNKMRIDSDRESAGRHRSIMIFDGDAQKLILVDPEKKTYSEMTSEQLRSIGSQAKRQMEESMAKLTPEQRKQMEQMMARLPPEQRQRMQGMMSPPSNPSRVDGAKEGKTARKWEPTGERKTVAGFACQGVKELRDGKVRGEGCYIAWDAGAISKQDLAPMKKMSEFFTQALLPGHELGQREFAELDKMPGFPGVWETISEDGKRGNKTTVNSIKRGGVSADVFRPPAGYSKSEQPWGREGAKPSRNE